MFLTNQEYTHILNTQSIQERNANNNDPIIESPYAMKIVGKLWFVMSLIKTNISISFVLQGHYSWTLWDCAV